MAEEKHPIDETAAVQEPQDDVQPSGEAVGEEAPVQEPTSREYVYGRLRERYPDADFESEDGRYGAMRGYIDETSDRIARLEEGERRLNETLDRNQLAALIFTAMARGENPAVWLMANVGVDLIEASKTEEGKKAMADAMQMHNDRLVQNEKDQKEWDENIQRSLAVLDEFGNGRGLTPEQKSAVFDKIWELGTKAIMGTYGAEDYELAYKALNYDGDVDVARQEGEVTGRNAKIRQTLKRTDASKRMPTSMQGGASTGENPEPKGPQDWKARLDADPFGFARLARQ